MTSTRPLISAWNDSLASNLLNDIRLHRHVPNQTQVIEAYRNLLISVLQAFEMDAGCLVFFNDDHTEFDSFVSSGYPKSDSLKDWRVEPAEGIVFQVAESRQIHFTNDVKSIPSYKPLHSRTIAQLTIPLVDRYTKRCFAVMALESERRIAKTYHAVAEEQHEDFAFLLTQLRRAVYSAHLERALELINDIAEAEDEDRCWKLVTRGALRFVDNSSEVSILRREGGHLIHVEHVNVPHPPQDLRIGIAEGLGYTCSVANTRRPFYCTNVRDKARYPLYRKVVASTLSQYTVPLMFKSDLVGVLNVGSPVIYGFPQSVRHLLDLFASHAANTLHYASLVRHLRTASHRAKNHLKIFSWAGPDLLKRMGAEQQSTFSRLLEAVESATVLVEGMVYPLQPVESKLIDITTSLRRALDSFQPIFSQVGVTLEHNLDGQEEVRLELNKEDFEDVVHNVLWNAIEAIEDSDTKLISVNLQKTGDKNPHTIYYRVSISDSGPGFRKDLLREASPKSLTKSTKAGARWRGMGLWICDRILANYGGYLSLEPAQPTGTVAQLYFPWRAS